MLRSGLPLWQSGMAVALLLFLWLAAAGPRESVAALGLAAMGFWAMVCPPDSRTPRGILILGALCILLPLLSFLPAELGLEQGWRSDLQKTGLSLGGFLTPQPALSLSVVLWQAAVGLIALRLVAGGHREENHARILVMIVLAFLAYGGFSMLRPILIPEGVFSYETGIPAFGFFLTTITVRPCWPLGWCFQRGFFCTASAAERQGLLSLGCLGFCW